MQGIRRQKSSGWAHVRRAIYTRVSTDQGLEQDFNSQDGFGRLQLFDAGRCQRHDLHVDTSGVHFGYAFVAKVAKQRMSSRSHGKRRPWCGPTRIPQ
jgi:hypothetical protein